MDNFTLKKEKAKRELKNIADIENAFKQFGKEIYSAWLDDEVAWNLELLLKEFDLKIKKLKGGLK